MPLNPGLRNGMIPPSKGSAPVANSSMRAKKSTKTTRPSAKKGGKSKVTRSSNPAC